MPFSPAQPCTANGNSAVAERRFQQRRPFSEIVARKRESQKRIGRQISRRGHFGSRGVEVQLAHLKLVSRSAIDAVELSTQRNLSRPRLERRRMSRLRRVSASPIDPTQSASTVPLVLPEKLSRSSGRSLELNPSTPGPTGIPQLAGVMTRAADFPERHARSLACVLARTSVQAHFASSSRPLRRQITTHKVGFDRSDTKAGWSDGESRSKTAAAHCQLAI